jgi:hypothetical protein
MTKAKKTVAAPERMTIKPASDLIIESVINELGRLELEVYGFGEDHADKNLEAPPTPVFAKMTEFSDLIMAIRGKLALATATPATPD